MSRYSMSQKIDRAEGYMMLYALKKKKIWFTHAEIGKAVCMSEVTETDGVDICMALMDQGLVDVNENGEYRLKNNLGSSDMDGSDQHKE